MYKALKLFAAGLTVVTAVALALWMVFAAATVRAEQAQHPEIAVGYCASLASQLQGLKEAFNEEPVFSGMDSQGFVLLITGNAETSSWTFLASHVSDQTGEWCILGFGANLTLQAQPTTYTLPAPKPEHYNPVRPYWTA